MKKAFIGGSWIEAKSASRNINPSDTSDVIDEFASCDPPLVEQAIAAARNAFPKWSMSSTLTRSDLLEKVASELFARSHELGDLLAREEGKTLPEATGEVIRAAQCFRFFSGEAVRIVGERIESVRPGIGVEVTREPVGVVALITPWNFPIAIPAWKIASALCFGNTVVFKPADLVPASAWVLSDIIARAGVPEGVFNLVTGRGSVVGETFVASPDVDAISFTGSESIGMNLLRKGAETAKKLQLEMGGKNPLVVLDDADLAVAVPAAINGAFYSTGQRCTASSRLIVTEGIHDRFVAAMREAINALVIGDARDKATQIGPVVSQSQLEQDLAAVERAVKEGARLSAGGALLNRSTPGYYMSPALLTETSGEQWINQEEVFGPVASVIRVPDYETALHTANDTRFGLSSGICTTSLKYASDFKRRIVAGVCMVNLPTAGIDFHVPFGGRKKSSYGPREQGQAAREFYTVQKTAYTLP